MFIELHILQNFAPSNLNRDDTGNPKDAEFGGVRRARISSQAIKRAIRWEPIFAKTTQVAKGFRTRWLAREVAQQLEKSGISAEEASELALAFAKEFLGEVDKESPQRSKTLIYLDQEELRFVVESLSKNGKETVKKTAKHLRSKLGKFTSAPDIALFGRMLARKPTSVSMEAACQVAHALSTHRVNMDFDFFTAVDDLLTDEEAGAGMMGITPFNSATYYRYARIDWEQLVQNLDGDVALARRTVEGFLRAALRAIPTGKQNAFAAQNPPDFALAVVREDGMAWSLVNAFETPVRPSRDGGLVKPSMQALDAYWGRLTEVYGKEGVTPVAFSVPEPDGVLENLKGALQPNMETWLQKVMERLPASPEEV